VKRDSRSVNRESDERQRSGYSTSTFENLEVYQVAREFRKTMYQIARQLPEIEKFGLAGQMRRAAISLTNNIAEGHGRYHYLDQIRFTLRARGSLEELIDDLNVCHDEQYLTAQDIDSMKQDGWRVRRLIDGYIRYLRQQKDSADGRLSMQEDSPPYGEGCDDSRFSI
jgi:four helix bundle protein